MTVLITPDKFKGSLTAQEVCDAIESGLKRFDPTIETIAIPMADGGEGSIELVKRCIDGDEMTTLVKDPLGRSIEARYFLANDVAYIEMSAASGLSLLHPSECNPLYTSTFGTGELILDAITYGAKSIYIFLGGSATNDMGIGMAEALGYQFLDKDKEEVPTVGIGLPFIMDIRRKLKFDPTVVKFYAVCDVENTLYGKSGAAKVYGKQKGAGKYAQAILDKGLRKMSKKCTRLLNRDVAKVEGSGAAGGLGAGILAFLDGEMKRGADFMLDLVQFDNYLEKTDLVIKGEGKLDLQTLDGKMVNGIMKRAQLVNKPTYIFCGENAIKENLGETFNNVTIDSILERAKDIDDAKSNAQHYLQEMSYSLVKKLKK